MVLLVRDVRLTNQDNTLAELDCMNFSGMHGISKVDQITSPNTSVTDAISEGSVCGYKREMLTLSSLNVFAIEHSSALWLPFQGYISPSHVEALSQVL